MPTKPELKSSVLWPKKPVVEDEYSYWDTKPGYSEILDTFGVVLDQDSDGSYQGDTVAIIERDGEFGWLTFGWGSCSGCDALQAADDYGDVDSLMDDLWNGIVWHESREALQQWLFDRDWGTQFSWYSDAIKKLLRRELGEEKYKIVLLKFNTEE